MSAPKLPIEPSLPGNVTLVATARYTEKGENCYDKISRLLKEEIQRKSQ